MESRRLFRPQLDEALEDRLVLSRLGVRPGSVAVRVAAPKTPPVIARINAAFDSFTQDYTQARGAYLAGLAASSASTPSGDLPLTTAFKNYTQYRVDLLGQQLNKALFHVSANNVQNNSHNSPTVRFTSLVARKVSGTQLKPDTNPPVLAAPPFKVGTLGASLLLTTPAATGANADAQAQNGLNVLAQDQAIQAARASIINGFNFVKATTLSGKKAT